MTVLLIGIGADGDNTDPVPPVDDDGNFDYLPIPETYPSTGPTYREFTFQGRPATEFVEAIRPGSEGEWVHDSEAIAETVLHHDPNFQALTYGDTQGSRKGSSIEDELDVGDIIGFYTGLQNTHKNRYLIGYFTVSAIETDPADHPKNAHGRRLEAAGSPKHEDVVTVDGEEPGGLLTSAYQLTERLPKAPWYRVQESVADRLNVRGGQKAISRKFPLILDMEPAEFIELMPPTR